MLLVEQCLITVPEHLSPLSVFCEVHIGQSSVVCVVILDRCLKFVHFSLLIVLSALSQLMASEYLFGIFKFFLASQLSMVEVFQCLFCLILMERQLDLWNNNYMYIVQIKFMAFCISEKTDKILDKFPRTKTFPRNYHSFSVKCKLNMFFSNLILVFV